MLVTKDEVEVIAQTLYDAQDCARGWDREPERLKQPFRQCAQAVIAAVDETGGQAGPLGIQAHRLESSRKATAVDPSGCGGERRRAVDQSEAVQACSVACQTSAMLVARSRELIRYSKARIAQSVALLRSPHI
ncbi:hypothetical protein [Microvirga sp. VF16]|uniref:hypothetical protein n=1 Tax=Microvirga sp. VF16 TaxID=2807101 RepID=UPI00193D0671|nr:hypothetical protein [Microvirga sp. VF16]QRM34130.1 hypothetical protein JO965_33240 [Microvirga sp. VF16]